MRHPGLGGLAGMLFCLQEPTTEEPIVKKLPDAGENGKPARPPMIEILIRFDPVSRNIELVAPMHDRVACYGMLEMARAIIDHQYILQTLAESRSRIVPATGPLPPFRPH